MALQLDEGELVAVPKSGKRLYFIDSDGTLKELKSDGSKGAIAGGGGSSAGFMADSYSWAKSRVSTLSSNSRLLGSDYLGASGSDFFVSGSTSFNAGFSGGVINLPATGATGEIDLGGTLNKPLVASPKVEPWAIRAKYRNGAAAFSGGTFICPIALGSGTELIYILSVPATSTTVYQLSLFSGAADHLTSCGAVGTLGVSTCPVNSWAYCGIWFDGTNLGVEFNDTPAFTPLTGSQLNFMGTGPMGVFAYGNDLTFAMKHDAMALIISA